MSEESTLEKRVLNSNLSDDDKIEIIQRLKSYKEYIYVPQKVEPSYPARPLTWPYPDITAPNLPGRDVWYCTTTDPTSTAAVPTCSCCRIKGEK